MTTDDIIRMAREAGFLILKFDGEDEVMEGDGNCFQTDEVERFAKLVAAHARETEAAKWAKGAKISVPTSVMEQQFSIYYRRGYEAGVLVNKEKNGG
jgi:hypothetical protein